MIHGLVQLTAALCAAAGVYLLLGLAPALVIVGTLVLVVSTAGEIMGRSTPAPTTLPRTRIPAELED